ncbi:MAG: Rod shape-determining protein MreC [Oscillospiraceae bacterium]|nr:Rod shape-determining protein MreC [Oscillospiraceae bacterium]
MKDFMKHNGILILIVAVLLAAITFVCSLFAGTDPLSNAVGVLTTPFRSGLNTVAGWVDDVNGYLFDYDTLKTENEALKQQVADLEEQARAGEDASEENTRLRELLNLREKHSSFDLESAMVTARSTSNWSSTLTISAGSDYGVEVDQCVIDEYGNLVGIVSEVGTNWATVNTVIDTYTELGGSIARTNSAAIIEGDFTLMQQGKLKLSYLPEDTQIISGDQILTSGKGGVYPSGLVVGSVEEILDDASNLNRYAVIAPSADLDHLVQVFVIKDFDIVS